MVTAETTPSPRRPPVAAGDGHLTSRRALQHVAALDGIRGVAVLLVLFFHAGFSWFTGGFIGVSVFFVLSGYLITNLLAAEHQSTGTVSLRAFWGRRFRRLAPAAMAVLLALLVIGAFWGITERSLGDIRAAALNVANWWFIHSGHGYADITAAPSPVDHFWSLAIEEQFYVVYPAVIWACVRHGRSDRSDRRVVVAIASMAAVSLALQFTISDIDRIYRGTDTRAFELLAGAGLALLAPINVRRRGTAKWGGAVGVAGLTALIAASALSVVSSPWLYRGGFPFLALCSCAVIWTAVHGGWFSRALATRPLVALGAISYGVYLIHWPVFIWLDQRRTGLGLWPLFALRMAITLALAVLSYRFLEQPIRRGRALKGRGGPIAYATAMTAVLVLTLVVPTVVDDRQVIADTPDNPGQVVGASAPSSTAGAANPLSSTTTVPLPPVIALVGDSIPTVLAAEVAPHLGDFDLRLLDLGIKACDGARGAPHLRYGPGREIDESPECTEWENRWPAYFEQSKPSAVVFMLGGAAVLDRQLNGRWTNACQQDFHKWYASELLYRLDFVARSTNATVILATSPPAEYGTLGLPPEHQKRTDCINKIFDEVLAQRPEVVRLDLQGWLCPDGPRKCQPLRSDGVHYRGDDALTLARWLFPEILRLTAEHPRQATTSSTTSRPAPVATPSAR